MALPNVIINVENGALGQVAYTNDGIAGMILSGNMSPLGLALNTAAKIHSMADAEALGITEAYDVAQGVHAHAQIKEFYAEGGDGLPLWIMVVANTEPMADICDKAGTNKLAKKLIDDAHGEIRLLGITRMPDAGYVPTFANGFDDDAYGAIANLESLLADYDALATPMVGIIEGRAFAGDAATLTALNEGGSNHVSVLLSSGENMVTHEGSASVGLLLGRLASDPVMRKCSRVKSGALTVAQGYLSDGSKVDVFVALGDIHDKGYIVMRSFEGRAGFYFSGDPTATLVTDDYNTISRRRVINKMIMIAYQAYIDEIDNEILITDDGKIHPGLIKTWESKINNQVNEQMTANKEISSFTSFIDPEQNVLSTNKMQVVLRAVPVGYSTNIEISIGFTNPAL